MAHDEIVEEVRAAREGHAARFKFDLRAERLVAALALADPDGGDALAAWQSVYHGLAEDEIGEIERIILGSGPSSAGEVSDQMAD